MPELRVDPLSGLRTIIAPGRSERPIELVEPRHDTTCSDPFAPGNEDQTPTELYALAGPDGAPAYRQVVPTR